MASIQPTFDLSFIGTQLTVTKDDWYDLGTIGGINSPVPSSQQLWLGYATVASADKALVFELRRNNAGQSTGTTGTTTMCGYASTDPSAGSANIDMYLQGDIITLCPAAVSTGVEKLWLRVRSGTATVASFDYLLFYTVY